MITDCRHGHGFVTHASGRPGDARHVCIDCGAEGPEIPTLHVAAVREDEKTSTERSAEQPCLAGPLAESIANRQPVRLGEIEPIATLARAARKGEAAE